MLFIVMLFTVGLLFASEAAFLQNTGTSPSSPPLPFPLSNQPQHSPIALFVVHCIYLSTAKDGSVGSRLSTYGVSVLSCSFLLTEVSSNTFSIAKEGDGGVRPIPERAGKSDWLTLLFECGVSESLSRLRIDAAWCLTKHLRIKTLHTPYTPFFPRDAGILAVVFYKMRDTSTAGSLRSTIQTPVCTLTRATAKGRRLHPVGNCVYRNTSSGQRGWRM